MSHFDLESNSSLYVIILRKVEGRELDQGIINRHVEHLRSLDQEGKLILCGPFSDHPSGALVIRAMDKDEATQVANQDPFVKEGYRTCEIRTWQIAHRGNNYLG
ncbi:MAG: hypothetical protein JNM39_07515 [Bdellovibrionaceae bacterium]|nr:hypothetical protein [Pseudobdellovibrionaceae bacterium]